MSQSRAKKLNRLISQMIVENPEKLEQHCRAKVNQVNIQGGRQHRRINPRRQMKKLLQKI